MWSLSLIFSFKLGLLVLSSALLLVDFHRRSERSLLTMSSRVCTSGGVASGSARLASGIMSTRGRASVRSAGGRGICSLRVNTWSLARHTITDGGRRSSLDVTLIVVSAKGTRGTSMSTMRMRTRGRMSTRHLAARLIMSVSLMRCLLPPVVDSALLKKSYDTTLLASSTILCTRC